jgi:hypothetical protein
MINHPNRSKRVARVKITLSNSAGPLDERLVTANRDDTSETIAHDVAKLAAALILETNALYPGDTIRIDEVA